MTYEYESRAVLKVKAVNQNIDATISLPFPTLQGIFWYILRFSFFAIMIIFFSFRTCRAYKIGRSHALNFSIHCPQDSINKELIISLNVFCDGKAYIKKFIAISQIKTEITIECPIVNRISLYSENNPVVYENFDCKVHTYLRSFAYVGKILIFFISRLF